MALEFNLPRIVGDSLGALREEIASLVDALSLKLRVEDFRSVTTYETGWSDGSPAVQFYKGPMRHVFLRGFADKGAPSLPEKMFTLPEGYRPSVSTKFWIGSQEIEVQTDGSVLLNSDPSYASPPGANLAGVSFLGEL